jgi:uncharacterized repeat protein (TIGR04002 family)
MTNLTKTKSQSQINSTLLLLVLSAMFAALIAVVTAFIKIPSPLGYTHAGDSMIYLAACVLPAPYGVAAAAIGGGLADLLAGYPHWAIPTAIIKSLNVVPFIIARYYLKKKDRDNKIITVPTIISIIPTSAVTIFGYLFANALLYDWASAIAEMPTCWVQPTAGAVLYLVVGIALDKMNFKSKLKFK